MEENPCRTSSGPRSWGACCAHRTCSMRVSRSPRGAITRTEFKRIEDRAIDEAIALQERAGVEVVTDGELRRLSFVGPLTDTVDGVKPIEGARVEWHDDEGDKPHFQPAVVQRLTPR